MKKKVTAAELMARLEADPSFVEMRAQRDAAVEQRVAAMHQALVPVFESLRSAGIDIAASDLTIEPYPKAAPHPEALPILLSHLQTPYPADARYLIAQALAVPEVRFAWDILLNLFRHEEDTRVKDELARGLAAAATDDATIADVVALVRDPRHGPSRLLLLGVLERSMDPVVRSTLDEFQADPDLAKEVGLILARSRRRKRTPPASVAAPVAADAASYSHEASTAFELKHVEPFLRRVSSIVSGFPKSEVRRLSGEIADLEVETEREWVYQVVHKGQETQLRIRALMDDVESVDLYLLSSADLAAAIEDEMTQYAESAGG